MPPEGLLPEQERRTCTRAGASMCACACVCLSVCSRGGGCILTTPCREATEGLGPLLSPGSPKPCHLKAIPPPTQRTGGEGQVGWGDQEKGRRCAAAYLTLSSLLAPAGPSRVSGYTGSVIFTLLAQDSMISHCFLPSERDPYRASSNFLGIIKAHTV